MGSRLVIIKSAGVPLTTGIHNKAVAQFGDIDESDRELDNAIVDSIPSALAKGHYILEKI